MKEIDFYKLAYYFFKQNVASVYLQKIPEENLEAWAKICAERKITVDKLIEAFKKWGDGPNRAFAPNVYNLIDLIYPVEPEGQAVSSEISQLKDEAKGIVGKFASGVPLDDLKLVLTSDHGPIFENLDFEACRRQAQRSNADREDLANTIFRRLARKNLRLIKQ